MSLRSRLGGDAAIIDADMCGVAIPGILMDYYHTEDGRFGLCDYGYHCNLGAEVTVAHNPQPYLTSIIGDRMTYNKAFTLGTLQIYYTSSKLFTKYHKSQEYFSGTHNQRKPIQDNIQV